MHADLEQITTEARPLPAGDRDNVFWPSAEFRAQANAHREVYAWAQADYRGFWADQARDLLSWHSPFQRILTGDGPRQRWFPDGTLNACHNALDRHIEAGNGDRIALHFEPESGPGTAWTYAQLHEQVCRAANALSEAGIDMGDRVAMCLPTGPEAIIAMLACARIGAIHVVMEPDLPEESLRFRLTDSGAKAVIVADAVTRYGTQLATKATMNRAAAGLDLSTVFVVQLGGPPTELLAGEQWWQQALERAATDHVAAAVPADHPLFVLYTQRADGLVGIMHSTGGYLTQVAYTMSAVFDLKPEADLFWCSAPLSDIRGHSYLVYGPLLAGCTQLVYPGAPDRSRPGRWWELIEQYRVSVFYSSPAAIKAQMAWGEELPAARDLNSLRLLACGGQFLPPETWLWLRRVIGRSRTPVVDTWLQPETGAISISALPAVTDTKPSSINRPIPGISADVVDSHGGQVATGESGYLVLTEPWPAMLIGVWGNPAAEAQYWTPLSGRYFTGERAHRDDDGDLWIDPNPAEPTSQIDSAAGETDAPPADGNLEAAPEPPTPPVDANGRAVPTPLQPADANGRSAPRPPAPPVDANGQAAPRPPTPPADAQPPGPPAGEASQSIPSPPPEPQPQPGPQPTPPAPPTPYPSPEPLPNDRGSRWRPNRKSRV